MKLGYSIAGTYLAACLAVSLSPAAALAARQPDDKIAEIVSLMGNGVTRAIIEADIDTAARSMSTTPDTVAIQVLEELKEHQVLKTYIPALYPLPEARHKGDLLYIPGPQGGVFGTMMIYVEKDVVATFNKGVIVNRKVSEMRVPRYSRLLTVDQPKLRSHAAAWAEAQAGKSINPDFAINGDSLSDYRLGALELVWRAYRYEGLDLDSDSGLGVYAIDIYNHQDVTSYQVVKPAN